MAIAQDERSIGFVTRYKAFGGLLASYLGRALHTETIWEAGSTAEALEYCADRTPALVIVAPAAGELYGVDLALALRQKHPEVRQLAFATDLCPRFVQEMMAVRINGIVSAFSPLNSLLTGVRVVMEGGCYLDGFAEAMFRMENTNGVQLSPREQTVLRLIAEGYSTKQVADQMSVSVKTAEKYRERIMAKLDLHDVVSLTRYALKSGISSLN